MSLTSVVTAAAESSSTVSTVNPWVIGGVTFVILSVLMIALLMFSGGRPHS